MGKISSLFYHNSLRGGSWVIQATASYQKWQHDSCYQGSKVIAKWQNDSCYHGRRYLCTEQMYYRGYSNGLMFSGPYRIKRCSGPYQHPKKQPLDRARVAALTCLDRGLLHVIWYSACRTVKLFFGFGMLIDNITDRETVCFFSYIRTNHVWFRSPLQSPFVISISYY